MWPSAQRFSLSAAPLIPGSAAIGGSSSRGGLVWVTNRALNNVAAFDADTGGLAGTVPVGRAPDGVTVAHGTQKAYVANESDNSISVISTKTRTLLTSIPVGAGPRHIQSSSGGTLVFFAETGTNRVGVVDTEDDSLLVELPTSRNPAARAHGLWVGTNTIYVAGCSSSD